MGGLSAAKATLEPHGGEWLPRQGNGKGRSNSVVRLISKPLGNVIYFYFIADFSYFHSFKFTSIKIW
jgi:hypothetical protein